jgi:two-component system, OmpR family, KDP operon response regulator KdpE
MNTTKKILVVDDDPGQLRLVDQVLTHQGYEVLKANQGQEALRMIFEKKPDLVLLDVVMPKMDGWQTCSRIREVTDVPVIMLTGKRNSEEDIVRGLDFGADEYLTKPVGNKELVARVRAALRRADNRSRVDEKKSVVFDDGYLKVDVDGREVTMNHARLKLTPREYRLLALLVQNAGKVVSHHQALENVWGWEYIDDVDYVRIYVSHLRQKLEPDPTQPKYIMTEPGVGYYFHKVDIKALSTDS